MADTMNVDDLELELRKLPGVRAAGFTEREDLLVVQVQLAPDAPSASVSHDAARIAYRYADKPVALEIVRWRIAASVNEPAAIAPNDEPEIPRDTLAAPGDEVAEPALGTRNPRVRLLAVLTFPDTDELEVHLTYGGRRVIGRSSASNGVAGAASATLDGLANFTDRLDADLLWAEELAGHEVAHASVVACALQVGRSPVLGIAAGSSRIEAAARATLHALNRTLEERFQPSR